MHLQIPGHQHKLHGYGCEHHQRQGSLQYLQPWFQAGRDAVPQQGNTDILIITQPGGKAAGDDNGEYHFAEIAEPRNARQVEMAHNRIQHGEHADQHQAGKADHDDPISQSSQPRRLVGPAHGTAASMRIFSTRVVNRS